MRVLHVNDEIGFAGGAEKNIHDVAQGLSDRGHTSDLLYARECKQGLKDFRRPFDHAYPLEEPVHKTLSRILSDSKPDVTYFHRVDNLTPLIPLMTAVPSVRMMHDVAPVCLRRHKYFPISGKTCHRPLGPWCILPCFGFLERRDRTFPIGHKSYLQHFKQMRHNRIFVRIVVSSRYMRDVLIANGFSESQIAIVPLALRDIPDQPEPIDPNSRHVLFIGTQIRSKGVDLFLKMLARLQTDFTAAIVGTGRQDQKFQGLCRQLGLQDRVEFIGWLNREQLAEQIRRARVVAVTSRAPESFNLVGSEAMGNQRPVVAFRVGGIPDWLEDGENGYLLGEQDVKTMAQRVDALLGDVALCRRLGERGREMLEERFRFNDYLDKIESLLLEASGTVDRAAATTDDP